MRCALGPCFGLLNGGDDDDSNDDDDDNDEGDDDIDDIVEYIRNKYSHPDACVVWT